MRPSALLSQLLLSSPAPTRLPIVLETATPISVLRVPQTSWKMESNLVG